MMNALADDQARDHERQAQEREMPGLPQPCVLHGPDNCENRVEGNPEQAKSCAKGGFVAEGLVGVDDQDGPAGGEGAVENAADDQQYAGEAAGQFLVGPELQKIAKSDEGDERAQRDERYVTLKVAVEEQAKGDADRRNDGHDDQPPDIDMRMPAGDHVDV